MRDEAQQKKLRALAEDYVKAEWNDTLDEAVERVLGLFEDVYDDAYRRGAQTSPYFNGVR